MVTPDTTPKDEGEREAIVAYLLEQVSELARAHGELGFWQRLRLNKAAYAAVGALTLSAEQIYRGAHLNQKG